jgi:hypothetical protein
MGAREFWLGKGSESCIRQVFVITSFTKAELPMWNEDLSERFSAALSRVSYFVRVTQAIH